jgi:hypothetical protein
MGIVIIISIITLVILALFLGIAAIVWLAALILTTLPISLPIIWIAALSIDGGWRGFWLASSEVIVVYGLFFTIVIGLPVWVEHHKNKKQRP